MYDIATLSVVFSVVAGGTAAAWLLARHDRSSAAFALGIFLLVLTGWTATHLGTLFADTRQWLLLYTQLSYVGVVTTPIAWFVFALRFTDRGDWLSRRRLGLLSVVPALTLLFVFTAQHHSLYYTTIRVGSVSGRLMLQTTAGPWHVVNVVYSYALLSCGTGVLAVAALSDSRLYRRQSAVLIVCVTVPWVANVGYHLARIPFPWFDATPMAFIATGIPLAAVVLRTDLASFLPVAHERVFRSLDDPIVVVSPDGTVIDANAAARTVLGADGPVEGRAATAVLPSGLHDGDALRSEFDGPVECSLTRGGRTRQYLGRRQPVESDADGVERGSIVALTDITARIERERELEELSERTRRKNEQLERMAGVISHDMAAPLSTAEKTLSLLRADLDDPDAPVEQSLDDLAAIHDRLRGFAAHLPRLARESVDVETTDQCDLAAVAEAAWNTTDTGALELELTASRSLDADRQRLQQVFENLFRNAVEHGSTGNRTQSDDAVEHGSTSPDSHARQDAVEHGSTSSRPGADDAAVQGATGDRRRTDVTTAPGATTVRVGTCEGGVFVEDDGPGIAPEQRETVFEYGMSTGDSSGFGLAIVRTIVEAHGWTIELADTETGGARFEIVVDSYADST